VSGNHQKTPFTDSLSRFVEAKDADASQLDGKSLPCSVAAVVSSGVVVVRFEVQNSPLGATLPNVMVPVAWAEYIRYPVQVGDKGMVIAADAYLGGVSGIGGGVASLVRQGNLSALTFQPLGNTAWAKTTSANAVVIYGVAGGGVTLLSDIGGQAVTLTLTSTGITITGDVTLNGNLTVNGAVTATGNVTAGEGGAASVELLNHRHLSSGGTGTGGPPVGGS
jgi:hypothetical protein